MPKRPLTDREKKLLKEMAFPDYPAPNASYGLTIWYNPEIPGEHAASYVACFPPHNKPWHNVVCCPKEELDAIQAFADYLEQEGLFQCVGKSRKDSGEYFSQYGFSLSEFDNACKALDPDGFAEIVAEREKRKSQPQD